jgi:hypothetical protein
MPHNVAELTFDTLGALGCLNCRSTCTTVQYVCRKVRSRKVGKQVSTTEGQQSCHRAQ